MESPPSFYLELSRQLTNLLFEWDVWLVHRPIKRWSQHKSCCLLDGTQHESTLLVYLQTESFINNYLCLRLCCCGCRSDALRARAVAMGLDR